MNDQFLKQERLRAQLRGYASVLVAFSGGVDSTYLLKVAHDELGARACALIANSCLVPQREVTDAQEFCAQEGIDLIVMDTAPLEVAGLAANSSERCYLCKRALMQRIGDCARARGIAQVLEGSNVDDLDDVRPGMRALSELGVKSPLLDCGFSKEDIRACAHELGLAAWDKPSAACLASRIPTGTPITPEALALIDGAEQYLHELGLRQLRVRLHDDLARIETDEEGTALLAASPELRAQVVERLRALGFRYVTLDLASRRS